jgi:hypothetical protein
MNDIQRVGVFSFCTIVLLFCLISVVSAGTTKPEIGVKQSGVLEVARLIIIGGCIAVIWWKKRPDSDKVSSVNTGSTGHGIPSPSLNEDGVSGTTHHDIFIGYSVQDKPIADAVCTGLEKRGIRCWIAPRDLLPAGNYQEGLVDAITSSKIMVLIYSSYANESPHLIREVTIAFSKKVIIIPFRIDDSPLSKNMQYVMSIPHWFDAFTPPLENHIKELGDLVLILLENERVKQKTEKLF